MFVAESLKKIKTKNLDNWNSNFWRLWCREQVIEKQLTIQQFEKKSKLTNSPIFKNCGFFSFFFASFAWNLNSNYWLPIMLLNFYEYHWQRWNSNFLSMLCTSMIKSGICNFSLAFAKFWKYVQGPRNESGPIRVWAQMSWDPNVL